MNRKPLRTETGGYVYTGINHSTEHLMDMEIKDLEHLKRETFKQWDRLGAIITLKTMESEEDTLIDKDKYTMKYADEGEE